VWRNCWRHRNAGATLIREGDEQRSGHLLRLLEGELRVDTGEVPIPVPGAGCRQRDG
jgi:hypothetical protein